MWFLPLLLLYPTPGVSISFFLGGQPSFHARNLGIFTFLSNSGWNVNFHFCSVLRKTIA